MISPPFKIYHGEVEEFIGENVLSSFRAHVREHGSEKRSNANKFLPDARGRVARALFFFIFYRVRLDSSSSVMRE